MDLMEIRRGLLMIMAQGSWKQKRITISTAISTGKGFADLILSIIPSGTEWAVILLENSDATSFINDQLIIGVLHNSRTDANNTGIRYRNSAYQNLTGTAVFTSDYLLTTAVGDKYTILYQE